MIQGSLTSHLKLSTYSEAQSPKSRKRGFSASPWTQQHLGIFSRERARPPRAHTPFTEVRAPPCRLCGRPLHLPSAVSPPAVTPPHHQMDLDTRLHSHTFQVNHPKFREQGHHEEAHVEEVQADAIDFV